MSELKSKKNYLHHTESYFCKGYSWLLELVEIPNMNIFCHFNSSKRCNSTHPFKCWAQWASWSSSNIFWEISLGVFQGSDSNDHLERERGCSRLLDGARQTSIALPFVRAGNVHCYPHSQSGNSSGDQRHPSLWSHWTAPSKEGWNKWHSFQMLVGKALPVIINYWNVAKLFLTPT